MRDTDESDEILVARLKTHDHNAFSLLVTRHSDMFYRAAYRMVQNKQEAEDIVQMCFLKIWNKPTIWKEGKGASFKTWFYRIVINQCRDQFKKTNRYIHSDQIEYVEDDRQKSDEALIITEQQNAVEKAIMNLPDKQRTAITLCFDDGISNKQAANIMGIKVKALESLLMRAKENIKNALYTQGIIEPTQKGNGHDAR